MGLFGLQHWALSQVIGKYSWMGSSKPLTASTVGPLGFYKCDHMSFGLVNALATFQRLMKTCLGDQQLNWHLIYLNDMIAFSKHQNIIRFGQEQSLRS